MPVLHGWESFYGIVGASAGALVGLQFVMLTLIAMVPTTPGHDEANTAFGTPTVVHFAVALLLSAIGTAPIESAGFLEASWAVVALGGVFYSIVVAVRMRAQTIYRPVLEDWLCHVFIPLAAYVVVGVGAGFVPADVRTASAAIAIASLILLFVGMRNAWDAITYLVFVKRVGSPKR